MGIFSNWKRIRALKQLNAQLRSQVAELTEQVIKTRRELRATREEIEGWEYDYKEATEKLEKLENSIQPFRHLFKSNDAIVVHSDIWIRHALENAPPASEFPDPAQDSGEMGDVAKITKLPEVIGIGYVSKKVLRIFCSRPLGSPSWQRVLELCPLSLYAVRPDPGEIKAGVLELRW